MVSTRTSGFGHTKKPERTSRTATYQKFLVCDYCRGLHLKCDTSSSDSCDACTFRGITCIRKKRYSRIESGVSSSLKSDNPPNDGEEEDEKTSLHKKKSYKKQVTLSPRAKNVPRCFSKTPPEEHEEGYGEYLMRLCIQKGNTVWKKKSEQKTEEATSESTSPSPSGIGLTKQKRRKRQRHDPIHQTCFQCKIDGFGCKWSKNKVNYRQSCDSCLGRGCLCFESKVQITNELVEDFTIKKSFNKRRAFTVATVVVLTPNGISTRTGVESDLISRQKDEMESEEEDADILHHPPLISRMESIDCDSFWDVTAPELDELLPPFLL